MTPEQRAFLDGLVARIRSLPSVDATGSTAERAYDLDTVRTHLIAPWRSIVDRLTDSVDAQLAALSSDEHARLRVLQESPSLLAPLGLARDEVTHSRLLAWFLAQKDDVGETCRRSWLGLVGLDATLPTDGWRVSRERDLGGHGRLDVHVEIPGAALVYVEVKIDAPERKNQLADYRAHLQAHRGDHPHAKLVFLTPRGHEGTSGVADVRLGFDTVVARWLPHAVGSHPTAVYLRAWLSALARDVLRQTGAPGADWSLNHRNGALRLLRPPGDAHG